MLETKQESPRWPYATMLLCGTMGDRTPASRRFWRSSQIGVLVFLVAVFGAPYLKGLFPDPTRQLVGALLAGAAAYVVVRAFQRYLSELDELGRRIQLEAIAFAFAVLMVVGTAVAVAGTSLGFDVNPAWVLLGEPLRAVGLVRAARKYA